MKLRILIFVGAGLAGLFWSLESNLHIVVALFVAPAIFGAAVANFWRNSAIGWQLLVLTLLLFVAELLRMIIYCVTSGGWHYLTTDRTTQLALSVSLGVQAVVAFATWSIVTIFARKYNHRAG